MRKMLLLLIIFTTCSQAVIFSDRLLSKKDEIVKRQEIPIPILKKWRQQQNVVESPEDIAAMYHGLTFYNGSPLEPKRVNYPAGYPVSIDVDRETDDGYEPTNIPAINKASDTDIPAINRQSLISSTLNFISDTSKPSTKISNEQKQSLVQSTHKPSSVNTTPVSRVQSSNSNVEKLKQKDCAHCSEEKLNTSPPGGGSGSGGSVCYLPRIVVNTRLLGNTVINEVKIYTKPNDENAVHRFVSSHEVSDAASKISHEFLLPPQFVIQKPITAEELKTINDAAAVLITSAYTEPSHQSGKTLPQQPPQNPTNTARQPPPPTSLKIAPAPPGNVPPQPVPPANTPPPPGPTVNPYLPTTVKVPPATPSPQRTTTSTTTTTTTTTLTPLTTTTTPTPLTTTTTTTTSAPLTTTTTTTKMRKRNSIAILNNAARHRNALLDVPGGDSVAWSGYQILGPPDIHQSWVTIKKKRNARIFNKRVP